MFLEDDVFAALDCAPASAAGDDSALDLATGLAATATLAMGLARAGDGAALTGVFATGLAGALPTALPAALTGALAGALAGLTAAFTGALLTLTGALAGAFLDGAGLAGFTVFIAFAGAAAGLPALALDGVGLALAFTAAVLTTGFTALTGLAAGLAEVFLDTAGVAFLAGALASGLTGLPDLTALAG